MAFCPCGTEQEFAACCGKFINNQDVPRTPEELMRSRYTAYTLVNTDYIQKTMRAPANEGFDADEVKEWSKRIKWLRLEVLRSADNNDVGYVEFVAHYKDQGKKMKIHETSEFHLIDGRWYYVRGDMQS